MTSAASCLILLLHPSPSVCLSVEPSSFHRSTISRIVTWPRNHFTLAASYNARVVSDVVPSIIIMFVVSGIGWLRERAWTELRCVYATRDKFSRESHRDFWLKSFKTFKIKDLETFIVIRIRYILCALSSCVILRHCVCFINYVILESQRLEYLTKDTRADRVLSINCENVESTGPIWKFKFHGIFQSSLKIKQFFWYGIQIASRLFLQFIAWIYNSYL